MKSVFVAETLPPSFVLEFHNLVLHLRMDSMAEAKHLVAGFKELIRKVSVDPNYCINFPSKKTKGGDRDVGQAPLGSPLSP